MTTTFKVRTADLRGYAGLLKRNAEHNDKVLAYLREWCGTEMQAVYSEGLLAKALNFHDNIYGDAERVVSQLGKALRSSATELEKVAKAYDGSDEAAKQRLESAGYHGTVMKRESWEANHSGYADYVDPRQSVTGSPHPEEFSDPTKVLDTIGDTVSTTGQALNIIKELTGRNPIEELVQFISGDWQAFSRAGTAFKHVGEALEAIGKNVDRGLASLDHGWDGGASETAYTEFQHLADAFKQMKARFDQVNKVYQDFARFAMHTASILVDTIKLAIDTAITIALRKKGGPFAEAWAAFYGLKILKYIAYFGWTMISARATVAEIFGRGALLKGATLPPSANGKGYDAPEV